MFGLFFLYRLLSDINWKDITFIAYQIKAEHFIDSNKMAMINNRKLWKKIDSQFEFHNIFLETKFKPNIIQYDILNDKNDKIKNWVHISRANRVILNAIFHFHYYRYACYFPKW